MTVRFYSSVATEKTLSGTINAVANTMTVSDTIGLPNQYPFTLAVGFGTMAEELVDVTGAAGSLLTITRGVDGTSATSHNAGSPVRHVASARDLADSRNHENSSDGVHGLNPGEDIVGTTSVQTLTNKTVSNLQGTLLNPDINMTGSNVVTVNRSPAGTGTNLVLELTNGTDQTLAIQNDGDIRVRNTVAMDTATTTRRIQIVMSDGTTERLYIDTTGMITSLPRAGTGDTFGGMKVIDPGDSATRKLFATRNSADALDRFVVYAGGAVKVTNTSNSANALQVIASAAQAVNIMEIKTAASADLVTVGATGEVNANRGLDVQSAAAGSVAVQVKGSVSQTASLQTWETSGGVDLARVRADGTSDFTPNTAVSGVVTASSGWTIANQTAITKAGIVTLLLNFNRTGANIVATADGNITDVDVCNVAAAYRPYIGFGANSLTSAATTGIGTGSIRLFADTGDIQLSTWSSGGTLATGNVLTITLTYPLGFS